MNAGDRLSARRQTLGAQFIQPRGSTLGACVGARETPLVIKRNQNRVRVNKELGDDELNLKLVLTSVLWEADVIPKQEDSDLGERKVLVIRTGPAGVVKPKSVNHVRKKKMERLVKKFAIHKTRPINAHDIIIDARPLSCCTGRCGVTHPP